MTPIEFNLPPGATTAGMLMDDYSDCPQELTQDILQICLPGGEVIDISWWPAFDLTGTFQIVAFKGNWEENNFEVKLSAKEPLGAALIVRNLIFRYSDHSRTNNAREAGVTLCFPSTNQSAALAPAAA
jgi:hypothetical protein